MNPFIYFYASDFFLGLIFSIISIAMVTKTPDWFWINSLITSVTLLLVSSAILFYSFNKNLDSFNQNIEFKWELGTFLKILGLFIGLAN